MNLAETRHLYKSKHIKTSNWSGECLCRHRWRRRFNGTRLYWEFGNLQDDKLRRTSEFVRHHQEVGIFQAKRDSEYEHDWMYISFMDEIDIVSWFKWSSGQRQQVRVYSDSVLFLVKMSFHNEAVTRRSSGRNSNGRSQMSRVDAAVSGSEHAKWHSGTVVILEAGLPTWIRHGQGQALTWGCSQLSEKDGWGMSVSN